MSSYFKFQTSLFSMGCILAGFFFAHTAYARASRPIAPNPPTSNTPTPTVDIHVQTVKNGAPIGRISVCAGAGPGNQESLFGRAITDRSGRAIFRGIPAGGDGSTRIALFGRRHGVGTGGASVRPAQYNGRTIVINLVGDGNLDALGIPRECLPMPYSPFPSRITISPTGNTRSPVFLPVSVSKEIRVIFSPEASGTEGLYDYEWQIRDPNVLAWDGGKVSGFAEEQIVGKNRGTTEVHAYLLKPDGSRQQTESTHIFVSTQAVKEPMESQHEEGPDSKDPGVHNDDVAVQAFNAIANVFIHPRCFNCHSAGGSPSATDASRLHSLFRNATVDRSTDCSICHSGTTNPRYPNAPQPPAANPPTTLANRWLMPPVDMAFADPGAPPQVRTPAEICEQIKDTTVNGGRTPEQIVEHVTTDRLVQWAWNPGHGLRPAPGSHVDFVRRLREWVNAGAACPR